MKFSITTTSLGRFTEKYGSAVYDHGERLQIRRDFHTGLVAGIENHLAEVDRTAFRRNRPPDVSQVLIPEGVGRDQVLHFRLDPRGPAVELNLRLAASVRSQNGTLQINLDRVRPPP